MAVGSGPMDEPYGSITSSLLGGGNPARPDMKSPAAIKPAAADPSPPDVAQTALRMAEAKSTLIQTTQALASFGDATQPKLDEDFELWQLRRQKITNAHEAIAALKAEIFQCEATLKWEENRKRQQLITDAHTVFQDRVETFQHCFRALLQARAEVEAANHALLTLNGPSRLPNDWHTTFYVPGTGMLPPAALGLTLEGSKFPPRST